MTQSLDEIHRRIESVSEVGFARFCGEPPINISLDVFVNYRFVDAGDAQKNIDSDEFESFLLDLMPNAGGFESGDVAKGFLRNSNSIAVLVDPYVSGIADGLEVSGLNNNSSGFSPPRPVSTIEWLLIAFAKEEVAVQDYRYYGSRKCRDLMRILEAGRLPVGWQIKPFGGELIIY
ncbi:hypothetical protein Q0601_20020 [Paracoccus onubensis]|uniref:hypothetical protein n=1 Tax=Paracoccus onubensis TaxID=1675788 RepID=UPI00272F0318|nr:hypothetical protein [Paracoccus onubensis]MDP0929478.1 hypothetical protein [Paracoccus onubensis]